jgi:hypothetical protein
MRHGETHAEGIKEIQVSLFLSAVAMPLLFFAEA